MFKWIVRLAMRNPEMRRHLWKVGITQFVPWAYGNLPATAHDFSTEQIRQGSITKEHIFNYFAMRPIVSFPRWMVRWLDILIASPFIGLIVVFASPSSLGVVLDILILLYIIVGGIIALKFNAMQGPLRAYNRRETITDATYDRLKATLQDIARENAIKRLFIEDDVRDALFSPSVANLLQEKLTLDNQVSVGLPLFVAALRDVSAQYYAQRVIYKSNAQRTNEPNAERFRVYRWGVGQSADEMKARRRTTAVPFVSSAIRIDLDGVLRFRLLSLIWLIPLEEQLTYYNLPVDTLQGIDDAKADEEYQTQRYFYQDVVGISTASIREGARPDDKERAISADGRLPEWTALSRLTLFFDLSLTSSHVVRAQYGTKTEYNDPSTGEKRDVQVDDNEVEQHIHSLNSFIIQKKNQALRSPMQTPGTYLPNMLPPGTATQQMALPSQMAPLAQSVPPAPPPPQPVWDPHSQQWILPPQPTWDRQSQQWVLPPQANQPPAAPVPLSSPIAPPTAPVAGTSASTSRTPDDLPISLDSLGASSADQGTTAEAASASDVTAVPVVSDGVPATDASASDTDPSAS